MSIRMKWTHAIVGIALIAFSGCIAKITVDRRPNLALPVYSNSSTNPVEYVIVDQGYKVRYMKFGFNTEIQTMQVDINTNKTVNFQLGGLHSNAATNGFAIKLDDLLKITQLFREGKTNEATQVMQAQ